MALNLESACNRLGLWDTIRKLGVSNWARRHACIRAAMTMSKIEAACVLYETWPEEWPPDMLQYSEVGLGD